MSSGDNLGGFGEHWWLPCVIRHGAGTHLWAWNREDAGACPHFSKNHARGTKDSKQVPGEHVQKTRVIGLCRRCGGKAAKVNKRPRLGRSLCCGEYGICSDDVHSVSPRVVFGSLAQSSLLFWPHLTADGERGQAGRGAGGVRLGGLPRSQLNYVREWFDFCTCEPYRPAARPILSLSSLDHVGPLFAISSLPQPVHALFLSSAVELILNTPSRPLSFFGRTLTPTNSPVGPSPDIRPSLDLSWSAVGLWGLWRHPWSPYRSCLVARHTSRQSSPSPVSRASRLVMSS